MTTNRKFSIVRGTTTNSYGETVKCWNLNEIRYGTLYTLSKHATKREAVAERKTYGKF